MMQGTFFLGLALSCLLSAISLVALWEACPLEHSCPRCSTSAALPKASIRGCFEAVCGISAALSAPVTQTFHGSNLFWFSTPTARTPKGVVPLEGAAVHTMRGPMLPEQHQYNGGFPFWAGIPDTAVRFSLSSMKKRGRKKRKKRKKM
eukprot:1158346-Pelagomonas_calceolata.AAC.2